MKEVDHILPRFLKGSDHPRNLRSICLECHDARHNGMEHKTIEKEHQVQTNQAYWQNLLKG